MINLLNQILCLLSFESNIQRALHSWDEVIPLHNGKIFTCAPASLYPIHWICAIVTVRPVRLSKLVRMSAPTERTAQLKIFLSQ